jgi:phosphoglycerate dehydrogenase-like enzyme
MADDRPLVAVSFRMEPERVAELFGDQVRACSVADLPEEQRARTVAAADALLVWNWRREFPPGEGPTLGARFVQLVSAGADQLPFDQSRSTHWLRGAVCGILGFGGIGKATGRLMRAVGLRVHAINTSGRTDEPVDFVGTLDDLDAVLAASDVMVVALPLTRRTRGLIGARELGLMKSTAVLVNVARGAIIDEAALYEHLRTHPDFSAGIDAWWVEPFGSGEFRVDQPFFELPNLLGSPHNSGVLPGVMDEATRRAAANVLRFLRGEPVTGIVSPEDYTGSREAESR